MIECVRVDYRLLHGQVAVSWCSALGINCILLVTDTLKNDPIRVTSVKLAKPEGCKLVVKNVSESIEAVQSGVTDKYKLMVVCETVDEGAAFVKALGVKSLNIGNTRPGDGKEKLDSVVYVTPEEKEALLELKGAGTDVYMQMIPDSKKIKL